MDGEQQQAVGRRIRTLREHRGLSLSALARAADIGKGSLSELEQGRRNPTLATLYALAGPLGVPFAALLGDLPGTESEDGDLHARLLHVDRADTLTTEVYWLTLRAGGVRVSPAHSAGVVEHLLVVRGSITIEVEGGEMTLEPGGSHSWAADQPHTYRAGGLEAQAVNTILSPVL